MVARGLFVACVLCAAAIGAAPAFAAETRLQPFASIDDPQQLIAVDVVDCDGGAIGSVLAIKTGSDRKPSRVMVMLSTPDARGRLAAIRPERLGFDAEKGILVADFTPAQLMQLAATSATPGGIDVSASSGMVQRYSGDLSRRLPNGTVLPPMGH